MLPNRSSHRNASGRNAFSMIEVVISTLLVGLVVVGSLDTLQNSISMGTTSSQLLDGPILAEQLLAEIMAQPYEDPQDPDGSIGPNLLEGRRQYDDVDDYDGWSSNSIEGNILGILNDYPDWRRTVTVRWSDPTTGGTSSTDLGLKTITVTATYASPEGDQVTTRHGYRAREGSLEQAPATDRTVVDRLRTTLTTSSGLLIESECNLLNHVEDPNG